MPFVMCPRTSDPIAVRPSDREPKPLDYARPVSDGPRRGVKHAAALAFAAVAIPLGVLFALEAVGHWVNMGGERYAGSRRTIRQAAVGFAECSAVTLLPGIYYAGIGMRGHAPAAAGRHPPGT